MTTIPSTVPETKRGEEIWSKITNLITLGKLNDAYSLALSKKDSFLLVRLMGKTGIVLDKLDVQITDNVVSKIAELLESGEFVELLLNWIIFTADRKIPLSTAVRNTLMNALAGLCESEGRLDEMQLSEANRAYNILSIGGQYHH